MYGKSFEYMEGLRSRGDRYKSSEQLEAERRSREVKAKEKMLEETICAMKMDVLKGKKAHEINSLISRKGAASNQIAEAINGKRKEIIDTCLAVDSEKPDDKLKQVIFEAVRGLDDSGYDFASLPDNQKEDVQGIMEYNLTKPVYDESDERVAKYSSRNRFYMETVSVVGFQATATEAVDFARKIKIPEDVLKRVAKKAIINHLQYVSDPKGEKKYVQAKRDNKLILNAMDDIRLNLNIDDDLFKSIIKEVFTEWLNRSVGDDILNADFLTKLYKLEPEEIKEEALSAVKNIAFGEYTDPEAIISIIKQFELSAEEVRPVLKEGVDRLIESARKNNRQAGSRADELIRKLSQYFDPVYYRIGFPTLDSGNSMLTEEDKKGIEVYREQMELRKSTGSKEKDEEDLGRVRESLEK